MTFARGDPVRLDTAFVEPGHDFAGERRELVDRVGRVFARDPENDDQHAPIVDCRFDGLTDDDDHTRVRLHAPGG